MIRGHLAALSALILGACAMGAIGTISEPYVAPGSSLRLDDSGVLHHDQISVSIVPENGYGHVGGIGIIVPIIPLPGSGKPYRTNKLFQVEVRFETKVEGYTFTPPETELHYNDTVLVPTRATALNGKTFEGSSETRHVPGHDWSCGGRHSAKAQAAFKSSSGLGEAIALSKGCVGLEFPVDTIHPSEPFAVHLKGLRFRGESIALPAVSFRKDTRSTYVLMGGS